MKYCEDQGFLPGIVAVLHTFGGSLNFHPHVHILLTLGGVGGDDKFDFDIWKKCEFFPEKLLKTEFKRLLLKYLRQMAREKILNIPYCIKQIWFRKWGITNFYEVSQELWKIVWYVYIGEKLDTAEYTARYIGRYTKRPCLSETRIDYYNYNEQIVKFTYRDKLTNTDIQLTLSVEEFIIRLIRHIPEENFRMIRYYGIYANAIKNKLMPLLLYQVSRLFSIAKVTFSPDDQPKNWRERIMKSTGEDPLFCSRCNEQMILTKITYRTRDGTFKTVPVFN